MAALYIYHSCQYICITMSYIRSTRTSAFKNKRDTAKLPLQVILLLTVECTFPWILKNPWHYWFKIFKSISLAKNDISLFYFPNYKLIWSFLMLFGHLYAYEFSIYRFWFYFPSCWLFLTKFIELLSKCVKYVENIFSLYAYVFWPYYIWLLLYKTFKFLWAKCVKLYGSIRKYSRVVFKIWDNECLPKIQIHLVWFIEYSHSDFSLGI